MSDKDYYLSKEFWETAPEGAQAFLDRTHFVKWEGRQEYWWDDKDGWEYAGGANWSREMYRTHWLNFELIERPDFNEKEEGMSKEWDGKGVPPVGTICESAGTFQGNNEWEWGECEIKYVSENVVVWKWNHQPSGQECTAYTHAARFRPLKKELTIEEKMLDAWKRQSLDFQIDNLETEAKIGDVFKVIVNNFDIKEKSK